MSAVLVALAVGLASLTAKHAGYRFSQAKKREMARKRMRTIARGRGALQKPEGSPGETTDVDGDTPKAKPVSDAFVYPKGGKAIAATKTVAGVIDGVHTDGILPTIPVKQTSGKSRWGSYTHFTLSGKSNDIRISTKAEQMEMTVAHEIGHFIDHKGFDSGPNFETDRRFPSNEMARLLDAIDDSPEVRTLRDMRDNPREHEVAFRVERGGRLYELRDQPSRKHLTYLNLKTEKFARAYAQYIAVKSGRPSMRRELDEDRAPGRGVNYPRQWSDRNFGPIESAMDDLFRSRGWIT